MECKQPDASLATICDYVFGLTTMIGAYTCRYLDRLVLSNDVDEITMLFSNLYMDPESCRHFIYYLDENLKWNAISYNKFKSNPLRLEVILVALKAIVTYAGGDKIAAYGLAQTASYNIANTPHTKSMFNFHSNLGMLVTVGLMLNEAGYTDALQPLETLILYVNSATNFLSPKPFPWTIKTSVGSPESCSYNSDSNDTNSDTNSNFSSYANSPHLSSESINSLTDVVDSTALSIAGGGVVKSSCPLHDDNILLLENVDDIISNLMGNTGYNNHDGTSESSGEDVTIKNEPDNSLSFDDFSFSPLRADSLLLDSFCCDLGPDLNSHINSFDKLF